jgi:CSLREA domain-containing protein
VNPCWSMSGWKGRIRVIGFSVAGVLLLATSAWAQVIFTVNTTDDGADINPGNGICSTVAPPAPPVCTLRAAVTEANRAPNLGAIIKLPASVVPYKLQIFPYDTDGEDNGDLNLLIPAGYSPGTTQIIGDGAATTIIDANGIDRVASIDGGRTLSLTGLTLRNGFTLGEGGAIYNHGALTLNRVTIESSLAQFGGAIYSHGGVTLIESTIASNHSSRNGGGLYNASGTANITRSSIAGNSAAYGGGVENDSMLFVTNSTISENQSAEDGGGIYNVAQANIYNSTIAFNESDSNADSNGSGAGVYNYSGQTMNLRNSVVAGNHYPGPYGLTLYGDCHGVLTSYARNRFYTLTDCSVTQVGAGDATALVPFAAMGALQDNGGPTRTIGLALVAYGYLIDYGYVCTDQNGVLLATDQRGRPRVAGPSCDVGAFEFDPGDIFANGFQ